MAIVQFRSNKKYDEALMIVIEIMLKFGIGFRTQYPRKLMWLGPIHFDAFRKAGLIPAKPRKRSSSRKTKS